MFLWMSWSISGCNRDLSGGVVVKKNKNKKKKNLTAPALSLFPQQELANFLNLIHHLVDSEGNI